MQPQSSEDVLRSQVDSVAFLTINRPASRNALTAEVIDALRDHLLDLAASPDVRVVVLAGSGGVFSAGADLKAASLGSEVLLRDHYNPLITTMVDLEIPLVASIDGFATGAGLSLALACDLRVCAADAFLQAPFAGLGLAPDSGMTWLLPRIVGRGRALEFVLTGRRLDARTALEWGMVTEVSDGARAIDAATELASRLAASSGSLGAIKRSMHNSLHSSFAEQLDGELRLQPALQQLDDYAEAISAFRERRKPDFGPRRSAVRDD